MSIFSIIINISTYWMYVIWMWSKRKDRNMYNSHSICMTVNVCALWRISFSFGSLIYAFVWSNFFYNDSIYHLTLIANILIRMELFNELISYYVRTTVNNTSSKCSYLKSIYGVSDSISIFKKMHVKFWKLV